LGARQYLNDHQALSFGLAGGALMLAIVLILYQGAGSSPAAPFEGREWLTVDDGKTFFAADGMLLPPILHEGMTAYRANVFTCEGGKAQWVGYIERYSEQGKALMKEMREEQKKGGLPQPVTELLEHIEIKRPGDTVWVKQSNTERAAQILEVKCPHGGAHEAQYTLP